MPDGLYERDALTHWTEEAAVFLDDAARAYTASMRQRIDVDDLYRSALRVVRTLSDDSGAPGLLPDDCPFTLDDLLKADVRSLRSREVPINP
jgi:hypothetical protein